MITKRELLELKNIALQAKPFLKEAPITEETPTRMKINMDLFLAGKQWIPKLVDEIFILRKQLSNKTAHVDQKDCG